MAKSKRMRLPNGFGRITEIKDKKLRNPFRAMVTTGKDDLGKPIGKIIGYYTTYNDAYLALAEYNKNPYDIDADAMTFDKVYKQWSEEYFSKLSNPSSIRTVKSAYERTGPIRNMRFKDIRVRHLEGCINDADASEGVKARMKSLFNNMFDWAISHEIVEVNYARNFKISDVYKSIEKNRNNKVPISDKHEKILWDDLDYGFTRMILINIYSGWRPQELANIRRKNVDLKKRIMIGGMKTDAGTDRVVPIHPKVYDLIKYYYDKSDGKEYLFNDENGQQGTHMTYDKYRGRFNKVMNRHGFKNYSASCPRHTFATKAKEADLNEYAIKLIMGHEISDVTEKHYTHREDQGKWLMDEICKIK